MGCYINPPTGTKEDWLAEHGHQVWLTECQITTTEVPVCLVDNGGFTAAAVAFDKHELKAFSDPADPRYKVWYMVPREEARKVSDLANWERHGRSSL